MNVASVADKLAQDIRSQDSLHEPMVKDLAKLAASSTVTEEDFHSTFLKALGRSGIETRIQNAVFHLLRNKSNGELILQAHQAIKQEPLAYMMKIQSQWERRILKSLNSMCCELGLCLAKPRCKDEQNEYVSKWNELSTLDIDLSLFRPVYAPKDFLEILTQVTSPNLVVPDCTIGKKPWKLINVPLAVPSLNGLREKFSELTRAEPHLGLNPQAPSVEDPSMTLEAERYALGLKVLTANHAPLSQEFLKKGCPHSLRGKIWAQVLGCEATEKDLEYNKTLIDSVIHNDVMVDKLIIKDVQLTAANDDNYFVFEDVILQVLLTFSRDTVVLQKFRGSCSNPARATLRGKQSGSIEHQVIYPPNGVIPFHGFAMFCAPFCYVYDDTVQLYLSFRAFYIQFMSKLHEVSSDPQGIVTLCAVFENLLQTHEPELWTHLMSNEVQPLRLVFRWMMRGFSGHLLPEQLLYLWDLVLAFDSMEVFPLVAAAIMSFRKENLMMVSSYTNMEAVLSDLSSLPVVPLMQLALERSRIHRLNSNVGNK